MSNNYVPGRNITGQITISSEQLQEAILEIGRKEQERREAAHKAKIEARGKRLGETLAKTTIMIKTTPRKAWHVLSELPRAARKANDEFVRVVKTSWN